MIEIWMSKQTKENVVLFLYIHILKERGFLLFLFRHFYLINFLLYWNQFGWQSVLSFFFYFVPLYIHYIKNQYNLMLCFQIKICFRKIIFNLIHEEKNRICKVWDLRSATRWKTLIWTWVLTITDQVLKRLCQGGDNLMNVTKFIFLGAQSLD